MKKKVHEKNLVLPDISRYFLIFCVIVAIVLLLWVTSPFFTILIYAGLLTVIFKPLHNIFLRFCRNQKSFAALLSTITVMLIFLIPMTLFIIFVAEEAVDSYLLIEEKAEEFDLSTVDFSNIEDIPYVGEKWTEFSQKYNIPRIVKNLNVDLVTIIKDPAKSVSSFLVVQSANLLKGVGDTIVKVLLIVLTIFFFFRDGTRIKNFIKTMSPLPFKYENEIERKLRDTIFAIVVGGFGAAILQGVVGAVGFAIAGVQYVAFLGTMMAFGALIPYIGASIIWVPVVIGLLVQGELGSALFLTIWGFVLVSTVDNFIKPILIGNRARMYPLATFLVVLGGLFVFGLKGIVFGPLILSLALTIFHIYRMEYKDILKI